MFIRLGSPRCLSASHPSFGGRDAQQGAVVKLRKEAISKDLSKMEDTHARAGCLPACACIARCMCVCDSPVQIKSLKNGCHGMDKVRYRWSEKGALDCGGCSRGGRKKKKPEEPEEAAVYDV